MTNNPIVSEEKHRTNAQADSASGVRCEIDGVWVHSIPLYLAYQHKDVSVEEYQRRYPTAPLYSVRFERARQKKAAGAPAEESVFAAAGTAGATVMPFPGAVTKRSFAEVFELGAAPAAKNKRGEPIMIDVLGDPPADISDYVPAVDPDYIFQIDNTKAVMMAIALNIPMLAWGPHGTGKTTLIQQYCGRTNRPAIRIQHTVSTEEAHVLGQYVVREGSTMFEPGPLPFAMRYGLVYIADEYDFALPSVTSVYQPVLEGQPLFIKEAPPEWRSVKPHPNFRFVATGNTNGGGDETGLYQGTQLQNAANYSRFGITIKVEYMPEEQEIGVVAGKAKILNEHAKSIVSFAHKVREAYTRGDIGVTVSPRELINAAKLGRALGGEWKQGMNLAFLNRLNTTDKMAVSEMAQRIFSA